MQNNPIIKKVDSIQRYLFSPLHFFAENQAQTERARKANIVLIISLFSYVLFFIVLTPTVVDLISSVFIENDMEFTSNLKYIILSILILLGTIQFISIILISLFILHIFATLLGGNGTIKGFYINYIYAVAPPLAVKFLILTIISYIQGNNFFLVFIESAQTPHKFLINLIIDPFFWWGGILGCIALKTSYKLTYTKAIIIMSTLLLVGIATVTLMNIF